MKLNAYDWLKIAGLLIVFLVGVIWMYNTTKPDPTLPILNPADLNPAIVADTLENKGIDHTIADFSLIDHQGRIRSKRDVEGKILVVDFFFTTCPSICLDMTGNLYKVQEAYLDEENLKILSHSVTPEYDSVPILAEYADLHGVDYRRWWMLTGDPKEINRLARTSYFAVLEEGQGWDEHSFIHTENLVLVDDLGRIRGYYDGTSSEETELLIEHIKWLLKEKKNRG